MKCVAVRLRARTGRQIARGNRSVCEMEYCKLECPLISHNAATFDTVCLLSSLAEAGKLSCHRSAPVHVRRAAARLQAAWRARLQLEQ